MLAAIILNSIHDAASYLAFICRVRIRVRFRSCPVYPLALQKVVVRLLLVWCVVIMNIITVTTSIP